MCKMEACAEQPLRARGPCWPQAQGEGHQGPFHSQQGRPVLHSPSLPLLIRHSTKKQPLQKTFFIHGIKVQHQPPSSHPTKTGPLWPPLISKAAGGGGLHLPPWVGGRGQGHKNASGRPEPVSWAGPALLPPTPLPWGEFQEVLPSSPSRLQPPALCALHPRPSPPPQPPSWASTEAPGPAQRCQQPCRPDRGIARLSLPVGTGLPQLTAAHRPPPPLLQPPWGPATPRLAVQVVNPPPR